METLVISLTVKMDGLSSQGLYGIRPKLEIQGPGLLQPQTHYADVKHAAHI